MLMRSRRFAVAVWVLILFAGLMITTCPAMADQYFNAGLTYFNQRQYQKAAPYFEYALRNSPWDSNAYYYLALTYHHMGDTSRAKQMYRQVVERFGAAPAAAMAGAALKKLDPNYQMRKGLPGVTGYTPGVAAQPGVSNIQVQSGDRPSADVASLPNEAKIYFTPVSNSMRVDAQLNGRGIAMIFDTGAESCVFGKNHLQQVGLSVPTGKADGLASGVGSSKPIDVWKMMVTLKVGSIVRNNFPISVQENLDTEPLLGQSFFKDFQYTVDTGANSIHFKKKGGAVASTGGRDPYAVPFTREGNEMVVDVDVNGRSCKMYFDTGAAGTIAFGKTHLSRVGLSVPDDAEDEVHRGVSGETAGKAFVVQRVKLGPVDKRDVRVAVIDQSAMEKPLLGHGFFGDWQFTIDNQNKVIRFVRR